MAYGHVMVDLETLDNCPTAVIVSIGAVQFNREGVSPAPGFYKVVDKQSCLDAGLTTSQDTLDWWERQSEEARAVFNEKGESLALVLEQFTNFLPPKAKVWGNGSAFDNAILMHAYRKCGLKCPFDFRDRCYRTVMAGAPRMKREGVYHNALDDARHQAKSLIQFNPRAIV